MSDDSDEKRQVESRLAYQFVQMLTRAAIDQKLALDLVGEAMLVEAVALLSSTGGEHGRSHVAGLLRRAADAVERGPPPAGRA